MAYFHMYPNRTHTHRTNTVASRIAVKGYLNHSWISCRLRELAANSGAPLTSLPGGERSTGHVHSCPLTAPSYFLDLAVVIPFAAE